jgi:hypothetical protein
VVCPLVGGLGTGSDIPPSLVPLNSTPCVELWDMSEAAKALKYLWVAWVGLSTEDMTPPASPSSTTTGS